jgi:hypothetical protein
MSIDPEKMKGGANDHQVNTRVSNDALEVMDYLQFVDGYQSRGAWVLSCVARVIEAEAPGIREALQKPEIVEEDGRLRAHWKLSTASIRLINLTNNTFYLLSSILI